MSFVMSRHGKDLNDDPEYSRRLEAGEVKPPASAARHLAAAVRQAQRRDLPRRRARDLHLRASSKGSGRRSPAEDGGDGAAGRDPDHPDGDAHRSGVDRAVRQGARPTDIPGMSIFRSGMVAMIALFGIAWMADTFIANNEDAIVWCARRPRQQMAVHDRCRDLRGRGADDEPIGRDAEPWSRSASRSGIGAGYMIAMWTAVVGVLFLPANGTQIAAAEADTTGTTTLGKRVVDHSFQLPLQVAWITLRSSGSPSSRSSTDTGRSARRPTCWSARQRFGERGLSRRATPQATRPPRAARCAPAESTPPPPRGTSRAGCAAARVAAMGEPPVGTVTFLFTDIEGSTRLARATGAVWQDVLAAHHDAVTRAIERHGGYVDAIQGDGFVAAFADARGAVDAALDAQRALAAAAWPRGIEPLRVRMGVHTGYVERTELGYVGLEVHRAARVGAAAHGGQILVTAATCALLRDETEVEDLGEHRLKDFPRPQRLFHVVRDGCHATEFGPLHTAAGAADEPARGPHGARGPRPRTRPPPGVAGGRGPVRDAGRRGRGGQDPPRAGPRAPAARRSARRRVRGRARAGQRSRRRPARRRPRARARRRRRRAGAPPRGAAGPAAVAARARQLRADPARRFHRRRAARMRSGPARARHQPGAAARAR